MSPINGLPQKPRVHWGYKHSVPNGTKDNYALASISSSASMHRSQTVGYFEDSPTRVE